MPLFYCQRCGEHVPTRQGFEMTSAARHAREAGHPPAGLTTSPPEARPQPGWVDHGKPDSRGPAVAVAIVVTFLILVAVAVLSGPPDEPSPGPRHCGFPVRNQC